MAGVEDVLKSDAAQYQYDASKSTQTSAVSNPNAVSAKIVPHPLHPDSGSSLPFAVYRSGLPADSHPASDLGNPSHDEPDDTDGDYERYDSGNGCGS